MLVLGTKLRVFALPLRFLRQFQLCRRVVQTDLEHAAVLHFSHPSGGVTVVCTPCFIFETVPHQVAELSGLALICDPLPLASQSVDYRDMPPEAV